MFKEKSFKKIPKLTINIAKPRKLREEPFDYANRDHEEKVNKLRAEVEAKEAILGNAEAAKKVFYEDNSEEVIIIYKGTNSKNYEVKGKITKNGNVVIVHVVETNEQGTEAGYGSLNQENRIEYTQQTVAWLENNSNYPIVRDFIERHSEGYSGLKPTGVETATKGNTVYFKLFYTKSDNSKWEIHVNVNTKSYIVAIGG